MSRSILVSFAVMLWFVMSAARPAAPPPKTYVSLDSQLTLIDVQGGRYKLGGAANDQYVAELDLTGSPRWWEKPRYKNIPLFDRLTHLNLSATGLEDADIEHVVRLRSLRSLDLSNNE